LDDSPFQRRGGAFEISFVVELMGLAQSGFDAFLNLPVNALDCLRGVLAVSKRLGVV